MRLLLRGVLIRVVPVLGSPGLYSGTILAGDEGEYKVSARSADTSIANTIEFDVRGETSRRAGVWITLDRKNNYKDNEYEMKILGQYYVTKVIHRISSDGAYSNKILGVKPYFYKKLQFDQKDILYKNMEHTSHKK